MWVSRQRPAVYSSNRNNNNNYNYYINNYQRRVNWSAIGSGRCSHAQTRIYTELRCRRYKCYFLSSLISQPLPLSHHLFLNVCLSWSRSGHRVKQYWSVVGGEMKIELETVRRARYYEHKTTPPSVYYFYYLHIIRALYKYTERLTKHALYHHSLTG